MATVKVTQQPQGQMQITIPSKIAAAYGIKKGQTVTWKIAGANKLELIL